VRLDQELLGLDLSKPRHFIYRDRRLIPFKVCSITMYSERKSRRKQLVWENGSFRKPLHVLETRENKKLKLCIFNLDV
jgi:hypothetical protein